MHWLGLLGMPRRVAMYDVEFEFWNQVVSICSFFLAASTLLIMGNMLWSFKNGKKAGRIPGRANARMDDSSPPPYYNFKKVPACSRTRTTSANRFRTSASKPNRARWSHAAIHHRPRARALKDVDLDDSSRRTRPRTR